MLSLRRPYPNAALRVASCVSHRCGGSIELLEDTMTEMEAIHRMEQMDAARVEFATIWRDEMADGLNRHERARVYQLCWQIFLRGKGLLK